MQQGAGNLAPREQRLGWYLAQGTPVEPCWSRIQIHNLSITSLLS